MRPSLLLLVILGWLTVTVPVAAQAVTSSDTSSGCAVAQLAAGQGLGLILPVLLLLCGLGLRAVRGLRSGKHPACVPPRRIASHRRLRLRSGLLALGLLLLARGAHAQDALPPEQATFNAQTFRPAVGPGNVFTVEGTLMPRKLFPLGGVMFTYAHRPLRLVNIDDGTTFANTVPFMLTAHLMPGFGITRFLSIAADLPVVIFQGFDEATPAGDTANLIPTSGGVGDLRLLPKIRILNNEDGGFGLAVLPILQFPTGSAASFRSENTFGIEPKIVADFRFKNGIFIALNVSYWLRTFNRNVDFGVTRVSDQIRYGLGIGAPFIKGFGVAAELNGAVSISKLDGGSLFAPVEGLAGLRYTHSSGLEITAGGGGAFASGAGIPAARAFLSVGFYPTNKKARKGTEEPVSGGQGNLDPDGDGVQGLADECPDQPGPADNKGCPEKDRDKDGVPDRLDKCPKEAGVAENNGCPDADSDKDGVPDRLDRCPNKAGAAQADGCPEEAVDTDRDGILDRDDRCPTQPGIADNAGCPDSDQDKDAIVDRLDKCPNQAGPKETDGCPVISVGDDNVVKLALPIKFAPGSDTPTKDSNPVIVALTRLLDEDPSIKKMAIKVEASGDKKAAKKLAGKRAKNLKALFVDQGVAKKRLAIKGAKKPGEDVINEVTLKKGKAKKEKAKKEKKAKKKKGKKKG